MTILLMMGYGLIMSSDRDTERSMKDLPEETPEAQSKWRGRLAVLVLVAGGLILLLPTIAIFLSDSG
ncbi:MAG: hypothetical protein P8M73_00640 [Luminiphilus sp.]|nr:hypothetical protein [Luminiphilus sp.]